MLMKNGCNVYIFRYDVYLKKGLNMLSDFFTDKVYDLYYQEVGKHPILSPKEERELLTRYHTCPLCNLNLPSTIRATNCPHCGAIAPDDTAKRVLSCTSCSRKFDTSIVPKRCPDCGSPRDMDARQRVVVANLRFVVRRAKSITTNPEHVKKLISAGNVGLMIAVDKFKLKQNTRFLTYAEWWIRKEMLDEIRASKLVHVPTHRQKSLRKNIKEGKYLCKHCGMRTDYPDEEESLPPCSESVHEFELPLNNYAAVMHDALPLDNLSIDSNQDVEEDVIELDTENLLRKTLRRMHLSERDLFIFMAYFGVPQNDRKTEPKSLHQLAALTGITPERVRQIKEMKLKSIRSELKKNNITELSEVCL